MRKQLHVFAYITLIAAIAESAVATTAATSAVTLRSQRKVGQTDKVVVVMEVGGEFKEHAAKQGQERRIPMNGTARLTYYEKSLDAPAGQRRSVRYYQDAKSVVTFKDGGHKPALGAEQRLVGVVVDAPTATLFSLREPFARDELEVIDILGNTLLLDDLLPDRPVSVGDAWKPARAVLAALVGLRGANQCDVKCVLKEVTDKVARVELAGSIGGPVGDTSSQIKLKGRYRFDRRTKRIDWFALVTREDRGISQVASGFDVGVRLQTTIVPGPTPPELSEAALAGLDLEPTPQRSRLAFQSPRNRWRILYDRRWNLTSDDRENARLKWIDGDTLAGQCNIASLAECDSGKLVSLEEFQADVRRALRKEFRLVCRGQAVGRCGEPPRAVRCGRRRGDRDADPLDLLPRGRPRRASGGADLHHRAEADRGVRRRRQGNRRVVAVRRAGQQRQGRAALTA